MTRLIVTAMKNEAPYLLEWVAYHRLIGFDRFLVYSNDCADGTDALLDRLAALGLVTHERNDRIDRKGVQWTALARATSPPLTAAGGGGLGAACDERLNVKDGAGHLDDLLAAVPEADAVALTWRLFGSNGVVGIEDRPVIAQFTRAAPFPCHAPWEASQFKTLFRGGTYRKLGVHRPKAPAPGRAAHWVNRPGAPPGPPVPPGGALAYGPTGGMELACLNHYSVRSAMAFVVKSERGLPNRSQRAVDIGYWVDRNFNTVEERSILRHLPALRAALAGLMAEPGIAPLHQEGLAWHRARAEALIDSIPGLQLLTRALGTERRDLDPRLARRLLMRRVALRAREGE